MNLDDRLRLFVAVDLSADVREALRRLQSELRQRDLADLRWARPEGVHLTLKFLGDTPAEKVPAIEGALAAAVRGAKRFGLALGAIGTFGGRRGPRVLWVDVVGEVERLRELQVAVESALAVEGFEREEREYSPHLTLARVRQPPAPGTAERVVRAIEAVDPPGPEFEVSEVALMRSRLEPGGAVYERVAAFVLS